MCIKSTEYGDDGFLRQQNREDGPSGKTYGDFAEEVYYYAYIYTFSVVLLNIICLEHPVSI